MVILRSASKWSSLQPFVPNRKTISIPEEHFYVIAISIEEDKERARKQLSGEKLLYDRAQSLEAFAHVDGVFA